MPLPHQDKIVYKHKKGAISTEESNYLRQGVKEGLTDEEMATKLNRNVHFIVKHKKRFIPTGTARFSDLADADKDINDKINNSPSWMSLKEEFTEKELKHFKEYFSKLMSQFRGNVTATEESQAKQSTKLEILMSRELINHKKSIDYIAKLEEELTAFPPYEDMDTEAKARYQAVRELLATYRSSSSATYKQYLEIEKQQESLLRQLKMTRDQRINKIDDIKVSWIDTIKKLNEEESRNTIGHVMEVGKKVYKKELERLSESHTFTNGTVDQPVLSADTYADSDGSDSETQASD